MPGMVPDDIDAIVLATSTPDLTFPATATIVQEELGMTRGFAFDVQAVCAGFVYALANANALILSGQARRVLVIGAETFSRIMNWEDRGTCVLFGDGAGALVLEAAEGAGTTADRGILATDLHSDGRFRDILQVSGGVSSSQTTGHLMMAGKEVFRHAVEKLAQSTARRDGQGRRHRRPTSTASSRIRRTSASSRGTARKLDLPMEKVVVTVAGPRQHLGRVDSPRHVRGAAPGRAERRRTGA